LSGEKTIRPLNDDHAIESVKFAVQFSTALSVRTIRALEAAHDKWRDSLPAVSAADGTIENNGRQVRAPGVIFAYVRPDSTSTWLMNAFANNLSIECTLYSRWAKVWPEAQAILSKAIKVISESQREIILTAVELTVKDVFVAASHSYELRDLLRESEFSASIIFRSKPVWHSHAGWFEESGGMRVLNNLDVDAVPRFKGEIGFNISHLQRCLIPPPERETTIIVDRIADSMNSLHENNKRMVTHILSDEMLRAIGLGEQDVVLRK
jgi:uncharacterized protein (TIGR04255 family)